MYYPRSIVTLFGIVPIAESALSFFQVLYMLVGVLETMVGFKVVSPIKVTLSGVPV